MAPGEVKQELITIPHIQGLQGRDSAGGFGVQSPQATFGDRNGVNLLRQSAEKHQQEQPGSPKTSGLIWILGTARFPRLKRIEPLSSGI